MQWNTWRIGIGVVLLLGPSVTLKAADDKKDAKADVVISGLKAAAPAGWQKEKPKNTFRQFQFKLPRAEGDSADAELIVSENVIGKTDEDILNRWKKMFLPPEGKSLEDISKTETVKSGKATLVYLDVQGTYLEKEKPIDPDARAIKRPNYRMIRVLFKTKDDVNYVSVIGPAKTVELHKKTLDDWLKSFK